MAKLKRNMIELIKNPEEAKKGEEPEIEKVWTPGFTPFKVAYEATKLEVELEKEEDLTYLDVMDRLIDFVANEVYAGKITKDDLLNRMHGPGLDGGKPAYEILQEQVSFASTGIQSDEAKNVLSGKSN